jgi:uncharacterized cupredoxin-like copper-binding protein
MPVLRTRFGTYRPIAAPVVALAALALGAAGCGGDDNGGGESKAPATTTPAPAKTEAGGASSTVSEDMTEFKFSDAKPSVKSGTVTFALKNAGKTTHALEVEGAGGESKTGNVDPGASDSLKVDLKPGKYEFYCPVDGHKDLGMKGEITVK